MGGEGGEENGATLNAGAQESHSQARSPATEKRPNRGVEVMGDGGTRALPS